MQNAILELNDCRVGGVINIASLTELTRMLQEEVKPIKLHNKTHRARDPIAQSGQSIVNRA